MTISTLNPRKILSIIRRRMRVKYLDYVRKRNPLKLEHIDCAINKYGNDYSFYYVPEHLITNQSVVYSVGVGEDIISDIELVKDKKCNVQLIDPTPQAKFHVESFKTALKENRPFQSDDGTKYEIDPLLLDYFLYTECALYNEDTTVKFFRPKAKEAVSHSIHNIQHTSSFIEVPARKLSSLMNELQHSKIDFLKLDIEGAEFDVLENIISEKIDIKCIYVEYHYNDKIGFKNSIEEIQKSVDSIVNQGYKIYFSQDDRYIGFLIDNSSDRT